MSGEGESRGQTSGPYICYQLMEVMVQTFPDRFPSGKVPLVGMRLMYAQYAHVCIKDKITRSMTQLWHIQYTTYYIIIITIH